MGLSSFNRARELAKQKEQEELKEKELLDENLNNQEVKIDRKALKLQATELGLKFSKNITNEALILLVNEALEAKEKELLESTQKEDENLDKKDESTQQENQKED